MVRIVDALNKGIWRKGDRPVGDLATIAATGLGRSGTTMVSRVLARLGLFMGENISGRSHEDREFQGLIKNHDFEGFENLCRARDRALPKWGFKCPALRGDIQGFASLMREPRFIVTFRDPLALL